MSATTPPVIIEAARNERKRLVEIRDEADAKIAELDAFLKSIGVHGLMRGPKEDPSSLAGQIKATARKLIVPGAYVPPRKIVEALVASGVIFSPGGKPPAERVTNVLSRTGLYVSDRDRGWSLKSDAPKAEPPVQGEIQ